MFAAALVGACGAGFSLGAVALGRESKGSTVTVFGSGELAAGSGAGADIGSGCTVLSRGLLRDVDELRGKGCSGGDSRNGSFAFSSKSPSHGS